LCRTIGAAAALVGCDVVEVCPERLGSRDITAHVAERIVRETLTGIAMRRLAGEPGPDEVVSLARV
jgi:agmatinase